MTKETAISIDMYHQLAEANRLRTENRLEEALGIYQHCVERFGKRVELLAIIAHSYFKFALMNANEMGENYEKAIDWLIDALTVEPDNAALHTQLAEVYMFGTLDYELAAQAYRRALKLNPYSVSALRGAASLYGVPEEVVSLEEAIKWMEQAIELHPDDPHFHIRLGDLYQQAGQLPEARHAWIQSLLCSQPLETVYIQSVKNSLGG